MSTMDQQALNAESRAKRNVKERLNVSRETFEALECFASLVRKWTPAINLVSKADRERIWDRHIQDSLGLEAFVPLDGVWLDIGSGGGFPAIPLALLAREQGKHAQLMMVESDSRKAAFLSTAIRELDLDAQVAVERIEKLEIPAGKVALVTARALASVDKVLKLVDHLMKDGGQVALLKGQALDNELRLAQKDWHISFQVMKHPLSLEGSILLIQGFKRAHSS